ncbi:uncharacterized protein EV422DRAFT_97212 [Fimicolochytrium jonesii]|uniref:uncharacterized protein n=1 Tax=Fimicolochytrium jonesii TaxID=1396493 RepID=UPI0022FF07D5|nr:uncharacterized protein EV422DRAFT_97212 [Fimicolochytrium jonesii]KAI8819560.1 hypothetical protein EV422DRAFT_97212 [Fimicolochytrium jonesii]
MPAITLAQLAALQKNRDKIRNICILAHVDHGKTTLSDSLLASNGIISAKLSGKVRYLDSREDEQQRGITMKSSGISLFFQILRRSNDTQQQQDLPAAKSTSSISSTPALQKDDYLINLIDSPGHVDFSSEVSTASRLCDGGLVLVDAVEGVCTQTHTVLRQAWTENVRPILVLNKIDRLITELKLSPSEAYTHLNKILEQVNAIMGTFYSEDVMKEDAARYEEYAKKRAQEAGAADGANGTADEDSAEWQLEHHDDSMLYFSPDAGNVIFASAIDGWAFRIEQFAQIYSAKLGIKEQLLRKCLWGDYFLDPKTRRVVGHKGVKGRALKPMFVQFILENIWTLYTTVLETNDRAKVEKIVNALNVKLLPRDLKSKDSRALLQTIMGQWLPLSSSVLLTVVEQLPSPATAQKERIPKILFSKRKKDDTSPLSASLKELEKPLIECDASDSAPVVAYVSKMFSVSPDMLPSSKRAPLTAEEMRERRRLALEKQAVLAAAAYAKSGEVPAPASAAPAVPEHVDLDEARKAAGVESGPAVLDTSGTDDASTPISSQEEAPEGEQLIGFARIYSGTIRVGQKIHVLGPKYNPADPTRHRTEITVQNLYLMMGRELQPLTSVPAGNVFGIGGLASHVLKTGTLSSVITCPSFGGVKAEAAPIVRVALEPVNPNQMDQLVEGLRMLNQADPCVEVYLQETGEHVIVCAGELHLERCLKDLRERFARCEIQVSPPIVPFRETISGLPALNPTQQQQHVNPASVTTSGDAEAGADMVDEHTAAAQAADDATAKANLPLGTIILSTPNKLATLRVRAVPLPSHVTAYLENNAKTIRSIVEGTDDDDDDDDDAQSSSSSSSPITTTAAKPKSRGETFLTGLQSAFDDAIKEGEVKDPQVWTGVVERIWALGPKRVGPNLFVNDVKGYERAGWLESCKGARNARGRGKAGRMGGEEEDVGDENGVESTQDDAEDREETSTRDTSRLNIKAYESSLHTAFQLATFQGPLCAEPMQGLCFFLESLTFPAPPTPPTPQQLTLLSGNLISTLREALRLAFLSYSPRLMLATYTCDLQTPSDTLGKVYAVLARRRGRILAEEMREGTPFFNVVATLPVVESFGFADELRKRTSGAASPMLVFGGFEVLDVDPDWVPSTEEELEDLGEKSDRENLARRYVDFVRGRKVGFCVCLHWDVLFADMPHWDVLFADMPHMICLLTMRFLYRECWSPRRLWRTRRSSAR